MSYLKNLTLLGKFSDATGPVILLSAADLSKIGFIAKVQPTVTREIVSATVGGRSFRYYRLVPPYGVNVEKQAEVDEGNPSFANSEKLIHLSQSDIELGGVQSEENLRAYAVQGGKFFAELVASLDTISKYNHGNFSQAVLQVASAWIEKQGRLGHATFAEAMLDQDLTDAIVGYLSCTQQDEVTGRERELTTFATQAGLSAADAIKCLGAAKSCREAFHSATLGDKLLSAISSSTVGDGRDLNNYRPFGDWKGSRENFFEAFQEYIKARALLENFIANVSKHAYVMLFLLSKYTRDQLPLTATTLLNDPTIITSILNTAVLSQKNPRHGLPAGEDEESVRRAVGEGANRELPDDIVLTNDEKSRHDSTKLELEKYILLRLIPLEITTRDAFLQEAEIEFASTVHRILDDKALALVAELAKALEGFANEARATFSNTALDDQAVKNSLLGALDKVALPTAKAEYYASPVNDLKQQMKTAISDGKASSYSMLAKEITATLNVIKAKAIKNDKAGTDALLLKTKQYSINLRSRIDVLGSRQSGAPGNPLALDAASVARVEPLEGKDATELPDKAQAQAAKEVEQADAPNSRLEKYRKRNQQSYSIRRSTPLTSQASTAKAAARPNEKAAYKTQVEFPGGAADVKVGKGSEIEVEVKPKSLGFVDLEDPNKSKNLSATGIIVDEKSGTEVGSYQKNADGAIKSTFYEVVDNQKCLWVSGSVAIDGSKEIKGVPFYCDVAYENLVGTEGIEVDCKSFVGNLNGRMFKNAIAVAHLDHSGHTKELSNGDLAKATVVFGSPFVEGDILKITTNDGGSTTVTDYMFQELTAKDYKHGKCGISEIRIRSTATLFAELQMLELVVRVDGKEIPHSINTADSTSTLKFENNHFFFPGQTLEFSGKKTLKISELNLKSRTGDAVTDAVDTPTIQSELGEIDWDRQCYDVTLTESRMANEFQNANRDPLDYWPCFHRARKFREQTLASHPDGVPFEEVDLGVTLEVIARMLRVFGNNTDYFKPGKSDNLAIEKLDLSQCYPISTAGELVNIIKQYELICHEDRRVDEFRRDLRNAMDAVEALKGSGSRVTIINQTLSEAASNVNRKYPSENFFVQYPSAFIFMHGHAGQVAGNGASNAYSEIRGGMKLALSDYENCSKFRHPVFTTDVGTTFTDCWFILANRWDALPNTVGNDVNLVELRVWRDNDGNLKPVHIPNALACAAALVHNECVIGNEWTNVVGNVKEHASFGDVVRKCLMQPFNRTGTNVQILNSSIWVTLANQAVKNVAFARWCKLDECSWSFTDHIAVAWCGNGKVADPAEGEPDLRLGATNFPALWEANFVANDSAAFQTSVAVHAPNGLQLDATSLLTLDDLLQFNKK